MDHITAWVFVHGYVVWLLGLALCGMAGGAWARWWRPRRRSRAARRQALEAVGAPCQRLPVEREGEAVTLRGELTVGAACDRFEDGRPVAVTAAAMDADSDLPAMVLRQGENLCLRVDGAEVLLDGPISLLGGADEIHARLGLAQLPDDVMGRVRQAGDGEPFLPGEPLVLRSMTAGQPVLVKGRLAPRAEHHGGYREAPTWRLRAVADGPEELPLFDVLPMVAALPARARLISWGAPLRASLGSMLAFLALAALTGEVFHGCDLGDAYTRGLVMAVTPLGRATAFNQLETQGPIGHRISELRLQVNEIQGRCQDNYRELTRSHQFRRVASYARTCPGEPQVMAEALYALGRFGEASHLLSRHHDELDRAPVSSRLNDLNKRVLTRVRIHILARREKAALRELRAWLKSAPGMGAAYLLFCLRPRPAHADDAWQNACTWKAISDAAARPPEHMLLQPVQAMLRGVYDLPSRYDPKLRRGRALNLAMVHLALGQVERAHALQVHAGETVGSIHPSKRSDVTAVVRAHTAALEAFLGHTLVADRLLGSVEANESKRLRRLLVFREEEKPVPGTIMDIVESLGQYRGGVWEGVAEGDGEYLLGMLRYGRVFESPILLLSDDRLDSATRRKLGAWARHGANREIDDNEVRGTLRKRLVRLARRLLIARVAHDDVLLKELTAVGKRYADALSHRRTAALLGLLERLPVFEERLNHRL